jgi:uncharacterized NAD(P)/FAD-binding protein YdhS
MKSDDGIRSVDAVVIGGGFSGTTLAAQLQRRGLTPVIIEGSGRAGRGTAFSTPEEVHLLNVPAGRMSAWPDQPDHFAQEVAAEGHEPGDFVPRWRFGAYLRGILDGAAVELVEQGAVQTEREADFWVTTLADGSRIRSRALVLAQGNQAPQPVEAARGISPELFVNDPWSDEGRAAISRAAESGGDVLIVGTGLTMVDVVLSLDAGGHQGHIVALSRRGLAPHVHAAHQAAPIELAKLPQGSLVDLWRWLRKRSAAVGWRAAVDSLRPHSHTLWQALGGEQQRRFLRHARPWWDVRRHRIAPQVAAVIGRLVSEGRLEIVAGRIETLEGGNPELVAGIKRRGMDEIGTRGFALGVNATGPLGSISRSGDPLLKGMFEAGLARPDHLELGIEVDGKSRVAGTANAWALGPMSKGRFWEITAVPDIRGQVAAVADDIVEELKNAVQS